MDALYDIKCVLQCMCFSCDFERRIWYKLIMMHNLKWNALSEINYDIDRSIYLQIDIPLKCPLRDMGDAVIFSYADLVITRYITPQIKLMKLVHNSVCIDWGSSRIIIRIVCPWHGSTVLSSICLNSLFYPIWRHRRTVISEWRCGE